MANVTAEEWAAAVRLATRQEELYAEIDQVQLNPSLEPNHENADEEIADEENNEDRNPFRCQHCSLETDSLSAFKGHMNSVRRCDDCSKNFCGRYSKRELKSHQKKEHIFKPKNPHICIHCHKPFGYASKLKQHFVDSKCGRQ